MRIRFGHSPDPDDAFMFYAIAREKIWCDPFVIEHVIEEIERLNQRALQGELEVTAISMHAYAYCADKYRLLSCGASIGDGYGPMLVSKKNISPNALKGKRIAIPGRLTTAYLVLQLFADGFIEAFLPFNEIVPAVQSGKADAGLLIHEGQIAYSDLGLQKVIDLGVWWKEKTGLPLPLGVDAIRKDIPEEISVRFDELFRKCIEYSLSHRQEAIAYAMQFGRGLEKKKVDRFIGMYVNEDTLDYGERGREAIRRLLSEAKKKQLIPRDIVPEFVGQELVSKR
ncbi:MAG: ABC transporter substrate-binding protein [Candidatus Omnitrophica bacterium]|nr:ABC transporter substrate-binding protein [Candidatus Omnitrophota bacterium]